MTMRYYQGRYADVWNSAVSLHGQKAAPRWAEQEKERDEKTAPAPWPPAGLVSYPVFNQPILFPGWRVHLPKGDPNGELDRPVP